MNKYYIGDVLRMDDFYLTITSNFYRNIHAFWKEQVRKTIRYSMVVSRETNFHE